MRITLMTHCRAALRIKSRMFQILTLPCQRGAGGAQEAGKRQPDQLTQTVQSDIPYHMASC